MYRVANALEKYAPDDVTIVDREDEADMLVLHVIGLEAVNYRRDKQVAVMQYCTGTGDRTKENMAPWFPLWDRACLVWSYYDLREFIPTNFYHAPLGIEPLFRQQAAEEVDRKYLVMTSGYVNGMPQEAIEEPTLAAQRLGKQAVHLGKIPVGLTQDLDMNLAHDITDVQLLDLYRKCEWVAGLRYVEGFELGVVEGLAQGARPVVFDRPDNRRWFGPHAFYVPECTGPELTEMLTALFAQASAPVSREERMAVLPQFSWKTLVTEFWHRVKEAA